MKAALQTLQRPAAKKRARRKTGTGAKANKA
jgi:hypothetical protein